MAYPNECSINDLVMRYVETKDATLLEQTIWPRCLDYLWSTYRKRGYWGLEQDVESLAGDSFSRALSAFDQHRNFEKFMALIFVRKCIDEIRTRSRQVKATSFNTELLNGTKGDEEFTGGMEHLVESRDPNPPSVLEAKERFEQLQEALGKTSEESREVIEMSCDGLNYEVIEKELLRRHNKTKRAKDLLYHNRKKVKELLKRKYQWDL